MVEAEQVSARILRAAVVVGAHLADLAVPEAEPLGAAVEPPLARLRVAPSHRPLDDGLIAVLDQVLDEPLTIDVLDGKLRVLADRARTDMRPKPRVVVNGVLGEVVGDAIGIAAVECVVVRPDVIRGRRNGRSLPT
jgi:hypothetical protein